MAVDEAIAKNIAMGQSTPSIRFYYWKPSAVSIGCFQRIHDEVDVDLCRRWGIEIVRRQTGGGAVYHDQGGEITYSIISPERYFSSDIKASYKEICGLLIEGLKIAGIDASFRPINDVVVKGRKISGSAQTRRNGVLTQHGTILYRLDTDTMFSVLRPSEKKLSDKSATTFKDSVTSALEEGCPSRSLLLQALMLGFTTGRQWRPGDLSYEEKVMARELAEKYRSDEWNNSR